MATMVKMLWRGWNYLDDKILNILSLHGIGTYCGMWLTSAT